MEDARGHRRSVWGLIIMAMGAAAVMLILSTDAVADPDDCPMGQVGYACTRT